MRRRNVGFTLIELILVIVILGVLAAVAVPKFINLRAEARVAKMEGLASAIHSAVTIAVAKWAVEGRPEQITLPDGSIIAFTNGYPSANSLRFLLANDWVNNTTVVTGGWLSGTSRVTFCEMSGVDTCIAPMGPCTVTYFDAVNPGDAYVVDTSRVTTELCS